MSLLFKTLCLLTVTGIPACARAEPPASARPQSASAPQTRSRRADEDNIREAIFRYALRHYGASNYKVVFLCVEIRKDPSAALLTRFANNVPPVKPFSACVSGWSGYLDRATKQPGILYDIRTLDWKSSDKAVVRAGYMTNSQGGILSRFVVNWENGRWAVGSEQVQLRY